MAGFALLEGRGAERGMAVIAIAIYALPQGAYGERIAMETTITAAALPLLVALALRSDKAWPLTAAAICLVSLGTNLAQMVAPVRSWAYGTACLTWQYFYLATLGIGTWRTRQGRKRALRRARDAHD